MTSNKSLIYIQHTFIVHIFILHNTQYRNFRQVFRVDPHLPVLLQRSQVACCPVPWQSKLREAFTRSFLFFSVKKLSSFFLLVEWWLGVTLNAFFLFLNRDSSNDIPCCYIIYVFLVPWWVKRLALLHFLIMEMYIYTLSNFTLYLYIVDVGCIMMRVLEAWSQTFTKPYVNLCKTHCETTTARLMSSIFTRYSWCFVYIFINKMVAPLFVVCILTIGMKKQVEVLLHSS